MLSYEYYRRSAEQATAGQEAGMEAQIGFIWIGVVRRTVVAFAALAAFYYVDLVAFGFVRSPCVRYEYE